MPSVRRTFVVISLALLVLATGAAAVASWLASNLGSSFTRSDVMPAGPAPAISVTGRDVAVSWPHVTMSEGAGVDGYRVRRYTPAGSAQTVGAGCAGTVTGLSCIETGVPPGDWRYAIAPKLGNWVGAEGPRVPATVGAPVLALDEPTTVGTAGLPRTFSGWIHNFLDLESLSFRMDSTTGPALSGSPGQVPTGGSVQVNITVPAGTSVGAHAVYVVASPSGEHASDGFTVTAGFPPPTVIESVIASSPNRGAQRIKPSGAYHVYANISGTVDTATANVVSVTTGGTQVPLTACASQCTVHGVTYGFKSALQSSNAALTQGTYPYSVTATNGAGSHSGSFSVDVDATAPVPTGLLELINNGNATDVEKVTPGDKIIATFSEALAVNTLCSSWENNAANQTATGSLLVTDGGGPASDTFTFTNASCGTFNFGTIDMNHNGYAKEGNVTFSGSTVSWNPSTFKLMITIGPTCGGGCGITTSGTPTAKATYLPAPQIQDLAGNAVAGTIDSEQKKHF